MKKKLLFSLKLLLSISGIAGLFLTACCMIFVFFASFEPSKYNLLFQAIYLFATLSCLSGILFLVLFTKHGNSVREKSKLFRSATVLIATAVGLFISIEWMTVALYAEVITPELLVTKIAYILFAIILSITSCLATITLLAKQLRNKR